LWYNDIRKCWWIFISKCSLCPRGCLIDRKIGEVGFCKANNEMYIARASLHLWEEPVLSGEVGSGTIFFSYCNLKCIYCQNYEISHLNKGYLVSVEKFADICLDLQNKGALNINLVTPTHYVNKIREGLILAKERGLRIPIVYNSSGYDDVSSLKLLEGLIDIYLPDLKYYDDLYGIKYSGCSNYFKYASMAIREMYRQVGSPFIDEDGIMKKGVIVRHLMLPGLGDDSKKIVKYLYDTYRDDIYLSIMNQYTPLRKLKYDNLNRKLSKNEYDEMIDYAYDLGIRRCFVQDEETQNESFIPIFDGRGVIS